MEEQFTTDYMKQKEREYLFKGIAAILIGFMLVLIAIFTQVAFFPFYVSIITILLVIAGIVSFVIGIFSVKRVLYDKSA